MSRIVVGMQLTSRATMSVNLEPLHAYSVIRRSIWSVESDEFNPETIEGLKTRSSQGVGGIRRTGRYGISGGVARIILP
jgi:hypothetical protein